MVDWWKVRHGERRFLGSIPEASLMGAGRPSTPPPLPQGKRKKEKKEGLKEKRERKEKKSEKRKKGTMNRVQITTDKVLFFSNFSIVRWH